MDENKKPIRIIKNLLDVVEVWVPSVTFLAVFVMYVMMIVYRYILNWQIGVLFETTQILYMMLAMMAASYGGRSDRHVVFPLIYNKASEKLKTVFRIAADVVVIFFAGIMIAPSWESISFIARKKTSILKVPFNIVYMPFLIFVVLSTAYYVLRLIKDVMIFMGKWPETEDHSILLSGAQDGEIFEDEEEVEA